MSIKSEVELDPSKGLRDAESFSRDVKHRIEAGGGGILSKLFTGGESVVTKAAATLDVISGVKSSVKSLYENLVGGSRKLDDLADGLASVIGPGEDASAILTEFRDKLSAQPGVRFEQAVAAYTQLRAIKVSAQDAVEMIKEVGNLLKFSGKDPEALGPLIDQLIAIDDKGKASVKQIAGLAQEFPALRRVMDAAFGTSKAHELEVLDLSGAEFRNQLLQGLKTLPRASVDMVDAFEGALAQMGNYWDAFVNDIVAKTASESPGVSGAAANLADIRARAAAKEQERLLRLRNEIELAGKLQISKQEEADLQRRMLEGNAQERQEAQEALEKQREKTDAIQLEIDQQTKVHQLMREQNLTASQALAYLQRQIQVGRDAESNQLENQRKLRQQSSEKQLAKADRAREIEEAELHGHVGRAQRLKDKAALEDKKEEYEKLGLSSAEASRRAKADVRFESDKAYKEKTGRNRSHGAEFDKSAKGIDLDYKESFPRLSARNDENKPFFPRLDRLREMRDTDMQGNPRQTKMSSRGHEGQDGVRELSQELKKAAEVLKQIVGKYTASPLTN